MKKEKMKDINWKSLSKKERSKLKKEQKRLEREKEIKRKRLVKWSVILATAIFLIGGFFLFKYIKAKRYENAPKIQVTLPVHNFGEILASKGVVETSFRVENIGVSALKISGMETSCGCTTAVLQNNGQRSPVFGMHDNPTDWSTSIDPRKTAELVVVFDPNFHKNTVGSVTRTVSIFSNDPWKSEEKVTIYANIKQ